MLPQQYCLRWKYHHSNLQTMFSQLLDRGCFCDVTLACEGQLIRAHRVVLCACSSYFDTVLTNYSNERDPIIIMKDVTFADVKCLIEFMYKGEINVEHAHLASLLKTADDLKIKGLAEVSWRDNDDDGPPMPVPTAEYYSPRHAAKAYYGNENGGGQRHSTPSPPPAPPATIAVSSSMADANGMRNHTRSPTPQPLPLPLKVQQGRMPTLTPIPPPPPHTAVDNCMPLHISPNVEHYMGVKRKRGRPPLDDTYDVFNLRTMHQYANLEHQAYLEASRQYADEQQKHLQMHQQRKQQHEQQMQQSQHRQELSERAVTPPNKRAAAAAAYHEHVQQQQMKQRILQAQREQSEAAAIAAASAAATAEADMAAAQAQDSEWISSNLEVTVTEAPHPEAAAQAGCNTAETASPVEHRVVDEQPSRGPDEQDCPTRVEDEGRNTPAIPKLENDPDTNDTNRKSPPSEQPPAMTDHKNEIADEEGSTATVPKPVEEIETMEQQQSAPIRSSTPRSSPTALKVIPASALQSTTQPPAHVSHYNKYAPEGYLVNEHGILMAPDFVHAPTVAIPTSSGASTSQANGAADHHHQSEYADIKMEDFDAADLRLTSEEITQWQDVIKMDDYLAKGRRPQFWEEPFTRRVLDSIKNKRLEMKKAARILGVSYGTLYGRYREVYGCLKHPYSGTTMRPNQLSLPPRLEYPFRNQANPHGALPTHLEIGKIRPKDLSELWARPQI